MLISFEGISDTDKIGHLFIVNLEFIVDKATEKELFFNEVYAPLFEKNKVLPTHDRSVFQLLDAMRLNKKEILNNYKCTAKNHLTMDKKYSIPICTEHLRFLIIQCAWSVTKIRHHFTFKQELLKKDFVVNNQVARQNTKTDFYFLQAYKFMKNLLIN